MVTPFDGAGELDVDGAVALARWLADHGSDGLVVAGTTGEGPVLSDDEQRDLWKAVAEAVTVPVLAGTGTNDTRHTLRATAQAQQAGVDGILLVTPYYNRPSQKAIAEHFRAVAASTSLPVMLYDVPVRTGRRIDPGTIVDLARSVSNVVAVKDATGDVAGAARLARQAPAGFEIYCGDDALTLPFLSVGAVGVVSVAAHWAGGEMSEMLAAFAKGDVEGATAVNARLIDSYDFESSEWYPNPLPAKAACRALGLAVGQCRAPMGPAPAELDALARSVLAQLGQTAPAGLTGDGGPVA